MAESARANGLVVNTFEEMETGSTALLAEATGKKLDAKAWIHQIEANTSA
jgi:hypothetical protein